MKDFLKDYQKRKTIWKIYVVLSAFVMAFAINFIIFDWNSFQQNLKTSVLESKKIEKKADFYLENENWKIFLKNSKSMENVKNISFSLVYDMENFQIDEVKSNLWKVETLWEKFSWVETIIINMNSKNISKNDKIAEIIFSKKDENKMINLNLFNSNFSDWKEIYSLTTSWLSL